MFRLLQWCGSLQLEPYVSFWILIIFFYHWPRIVKCVLTYEGFSWRWICWDMTASEVEESLPVQTITHETKGLGPNTDPGTFLPWLFHRPPQFGPSVALNSWFTLALQPCSFVSLLRLCISLWFVSLLDHPSRLQLGFSLPGLLCSSSYTVPVQHA